MKKIITIFFLIISYQVGFSQLIEPQEMGQVTIDELKMNFYEKDSTASAVMLKEQYFTYYNPTKKNAFTKHYYIRMKIFKQDGYKHATISIPFYKSSKIKDIEAVTYNLSSNGEIEKTIVDKKDILKGNVSKNVKSKSFAMPNVKVGSIIEYKFTLKYGGGYGIYDWVVQSEVPKIKSIYKAFLPVDLRSRIIGYIVPTYNSTNYRKRCLGNNGCTFANFEFTDVPAFIEEQYLTSKWNYITRLSFEKNYYSGGVSQGPNREWRALDQNFKKYYGKEKDNSSYLKKQLPLDILNESDDLKKAKKVYSFIQNHFTLTDNGDGNLTKDFNNKTANAGNINISLHNAFKAAGLVDTQLALLSTRENGFVTDFHPTITDFNYILVKLNINGTKYLLDATDKNIPFGLIPFQSLTNKIRVLDYLAGSYWEKIIPNKNNAIKVRVNLTVGEDATIEGNKSISRNGYPAYFTRKAIDNYSEEKYLEEVESQYLDFEIDTYKNEKLTEIDQTFKEEFTLSSEDNSSLNLASLLGFSKTTPFKLKERKYPVDYGYKRKNTYLLNITLPKSYEVKGLPENAVFKLPGNDASYIFKVSRMGNKLSIYIKSQINRTVFLAKNYQELKAYYSKIMNIQNSVLEFYKK